MDILRTYFGDNRTIFADNYFTSPNLAKKLLESKTYLCGTLRSNRKNVPKAPKLKKTEMVAYRSSAPVNDVMQWDIGVTKGLL